MSNSNPAAPEISVSARDLVVYVTYKDNEFYIGKSSRRRLAEGYQGSGVLMKLKLKKYPGMFTTKILKDNLTAEEAYNLEKVLVTNETLEMEGCLNLIIGGGAHDPTETQKLTRGQKISQTRKERMKDPVFKAKYQEMMRHRGRVAAKKKLDEPYIIDGKEVVMTCHELRQYNSKLNADRYYLVKQKDGSFITEDRGFYLNDVRYTRKMDLKANAGIALNRLVWDADGRRVLKIRPCQRTGPKVKSR